MTDPAGPPPTDLADRYGVSRHRRLLVAVVAGVLATVFLAWLAWTAWFHATPDVQSRLLGYEVVDDHESVATVQVQLGDPEVEATCTVRATAEDHATVGEQAFAVPPADADPDQSTFTLDVSIRTERRATTVERIGCTTADQARPR